MGVCKPYKKNYFLFLLTLLAILNGCDRYARYRTLNFIFDGVPHPDAPLMNKGFSAGYGTSDNHKKKIAPVIYRHPSADALNECTFCHGLGTPNNMIIPPRDMCLKCHAHVKANLPYVHGPAALDCIICHDVHKSETKTLVRKAEKPLCFTCHYTKNKADVKKTEAHKVEENELICLDCHDPHGGRDRYFLKNVNSIKS